MQQKLFVLFHGRMPSEKAAALWAAKTAEALAHTGAAVELLVSAHHAEQDPFALYGLDRAFSLHRLAGFDMTRSRLPVGVAFIISVVSFAHGCVSYLRRYAPREAAIISNEPLALYALSFFFPNCYYELHVFPRHQWLYRVLMRRVRGVIAINRYLADESVRVFHLPQERVVVARSGVEIGDFDIGLTRAEARAQLALPQAARIILYTGHLYAWKGADTLAQAAKEMPETLAVFVGGTAADAASFKERFGSAANIRIMGHVPHAEIPLWQKAADVLVIPNTAKEAISKYFTSPMKLFEYMASGTPIVASRLPSLIEVISDETAFLVEPDDARALAEGVTSVLSQPVEAHARVAAARASVEQYSWKARGTLIAAFISAR